VRRPPRRTMSRLTSARRPRANRAMARRRATGWARFAGASGAASAFDVGGARRPIVFAEFGAPRMRSFDGGEARRAGARSREGRRRRRDARPSTVCSGRATQSRVTSRCGPIGRARDGRRRNRPSQQAAWLRRAVAVSAQRVPAAGAWCRERVSRRRGAAPSRERAEGAGVRIPSQRLV
jgi:hypothetical protein